jgi:hypothetical protein
MNRSEILNKLVDTIFDFLSSVIGNFASNIVPLLAGILPAYLTWTHIVNVLGFPNWVGLAGAGVIEFIGLGAGNELMKVWNHNRRYRDKTNQMPMFAPFLTAFWYVAIMVAFNVILEAQPNSVFWKIVSIALFATLAIPAYTLVAGKTLRMEWKNERTQNLAERRDNRNAERTSTEQRTNKRTANKRRTNAPNNEQRTKIAKFVRSVQKSEQRTPGPTEIANAVGTSKSYAYETLQLILEHDKNKE